MYPLQCKYQFSMVKAHKNWHPTISSHCQCQFLLLLPTKTTHIRTSLSAPSSLIYWPESFSILVIHCLTTHLYFSTQQRTIHSNKRKLTYLSPIGYLPMLTLYDAILEILPYKLPISRLPPVSSSLFLVTQTCNCNNQNVLFKRFKAFCINNILLDFQSNCAEWGYQKFGEIPQVP